MQVSIQAELFGSEQWEGLAHIVIRIQIANAKKSKLDLFRSLVSRL